MFSKKTANDSIQVRRDFRVKWYRSPVDKSVLQELHKRSDIKGYIQTLGHLSLLTCMGALTAVFFGAGAVDLVLHCTLVPWVLWFNA